jgi:hypothetical protein
MHNKKGQGLSLNMIIVAALALIVLLIISLIFVSRANLFNRETNSCVSNSGVCIINSDPRMSNQDACEDYASSPGYIAIHNREAIAKYRSDLSCSSGDDGDLGKICCMVIG